MTEPDHFRLFIALAVPESVKTQIQSAQDALRHCLPQASVRWTRPEQFHLTLRFLGRVAAAEVSALTQAAKTACALFPPLDLTAESVGTFPPRGQPRVIWVGVRDQVGNLPLLQKELQAATLSFTAEPPEKTFTGHVTLGRIKENRPSESDALSAEVSRFANQTFGQWRATELHLMRSELGSQGARHSLFASLPLSRAV